MDVEERQKILGVLSNTPHIMCWLDIIGISSLNELKGVDPEVLR